MSFLTTRLIATLLLILLSPFQASVATERSDELIQRDIKAKLGETRAFSGTQINVHVERQLVVLTGEVRLYEQKLVCERIAWTTTGVYEVDNEIRVRPRIPVSDTAIERKIAEIVVNDDRFRTAGVNAQVSDGRIVLNGNFVNFSDPTTLKHRIAEIEGVITIDMQATFLAQLR